MTTIDREYVIIPIHRRQDLIQDCCTLLNSEWPRSESARYIMLSSYTNEFYNQIIFFL